MTSPYGRDAKRGGNRYKSGRCSFWQKTKCMTEGGSAFVTLPQPARDQVWTRTEAIKIPKAVVPELRNGNRKASFVRPELRVRARHLRGECMLRHASLTALL